MNLIVTVFAAVVVTAIWYSSSKRDSLCLGTLCFLLWGVSIMWLADVIVNYVSNRYFYSFFDFYPEDFVLGLAVLAVALVIWIVVLLIKDPAGVIAEKIKKNK